jgi:hypothetical protein
MQGSGGLILLMPILIEHHTERRPGPALRRIPLIPPPTSHIAFMRLARVCLPFNASTATLLLEHELTVAIFEPPQPRQEGQAEQIFAQGFVRQDKRGDVAHFQIADLNKVETR